MMNSENQQPPTLKTLRDSIGLTQPELSKRLGVSVRSITAWESGEYVPAFDRAIVLAKELGVSLKTLAKSMHLDVSGIPDDQPLTKPSSENRAPIAIPKDDSLG